MASSGFALVQVSPDQNCTPEQESRDGYTGCCRSNPFCPSQSFCIFEFHVNTGRIEPIGQVKEVLHYRFKKELDGMAVCTAYQLPICQVRASSHPRERDSAGLELLPELRK